MRSNNTDKLDVFLNDLYFHDKKNGFYLQAGAYNGIGDSITYAYNKELGWKGLMVEPNKRLLSSIQKHRPEDIIINAGLGDKTCIQEYEYLPSRDDSGGFQLSQEHKDKLRKIGFNGQSTKEPLQVFSYKELVKAFSISKIDLAVIDVEGFQNKVLGNIVSSDVKPTFVVVEHIHSDKQQLQDIMHHDYDLIKDINKDFVFQRRYTVLVITRCTRPQHLKHMLKSLNSCFRNTKFNFLWYVAVDANKVSQIELELNAGELKVDDPRNKIILKRVEHTAVCSHASDLLNIALFDPEAVSADYVYTLDDDNCMHHNLLSIIEQYIETDFDMLIVNCQDYSTNNITSLSLNCNGHVDTANMVFSGRALKGLGGYVIKIKAKDMIEDALTCSKFIELNKKIIYSNQTGAFYNALSNRRVAVPIV